jgi:hypothetical protein
MSSKLEFSRSAFGRSDLYFSWFKTSADKADLKNLLNLHELKSISDFASRFEVDNDFGYLHKKIQKLLKLHEGKSIESIVPKFILDDFVDCRNEILNAACENIEDVDSEEFVEFYTSDIFKVPSLLKRTLETTNGQQTLDFEFSKNFRLKCRSGLNVLNMPKRERSQIIPQEDDHILYACDFKQFEFRTFLKIHPLLEVPDDNNLYKYFSNKLKISEENCKISIISYLYGSKNDLLDEFFQKDEIDVDSELFSFEGKYIFLDLEQENHKKFHSIIQSMSQFAILQKILDLLNLLKDYDSQFLFCLHDELLFSIKKDEFKDLIPKIRSVIIDETYKIHESIGLNYFEMRKI